jgi:tRNA-specific 2-thiouridylase
MKIAVALSGGVDSSVALSLLKKQGHTVCGIFMKNWEDDEECPAIKDYEDALMVCNTLDVPLYSFNFSKDYWDKVFTKFLEGLKQGYTPNPDILCNREIKFDTLLAKALELGYEKLATGHYAQNIEGSLVKGVDLSKDQSYFLYTLKKEDLDKVLFPIGALPKTEVRAIAEKEGLITHNKKDSTGICFVGKRRFKDFIAGYIPKQDGVFQTPEGKIIGKHSGAFFYTIGQRKGMGIGGPGDAWFVAGKDINTGVVTVVQGEDHPILYKDFLIAGDLTFVNESPKEFPYACLAKIRYRQEDQECIIEEIEDGKAFVRFKNAQRAVTPSQSIVFYTKDICIGGGIILS